MICSLLNVKRSQIHGRGCFAGVDLSPGIMIPITNTLVEKETDWTITDGEQVYDLFAPFRFLNHSDNANAEVVWIDDIMYLHIMELTKVGHELTINYEPD